MKNLNFWTIATILCSQVIFGMYLDNSRLRWRLELSEKAKSITEDQVEELMYDLYTLRIEKESLASKSYIAGIVDSIKEKDNYSAIWHDGYNRGGMVAEYASEIIKSESKSSER